MVDSDFEEPLSPNPSNDGAIIEEDGEDLIGDGMENDYQPIAELDNYDEDELDMQEYADLTAEERAEAERRIRKRERDEGVRMPDAFSEEEEDFDEHLSRRRRTDDAAIVGLDEDVEDEVMLDENPKGPLREYVCHDAVRRAIAKQFRQFLKTFVTKDNKSVYEERIRKMCAANRRDLVVSYVHLSTMAPLLAIWVADCPSEMLKIFDEVTMEVVLEKFEYYHAVHSEVHVRIAELPIKDKLRDIRQAHLNFLIRVGGVVTRRTAVFPQLKHVKYDCAKCGYTLGPFVQTGDSEIKVGHCPECQSRGPFSINVEETVYENFQKISLQESPGTVPAGRLPRTKEVILTADLIDCCRPGEEIEVIGIYKNTFDTALNKRHGFPVFATVIEANHIMKKGDEVDSFQLTDEDVKEITSLAKDKRIGEKLIQSIAPSIYGHDHIKSAICLSMFGGVPKNVGGKHRIRGDINVLVLGDPGVAKSQFLKFVEKTAPRAVYATGQGASAVGLTAAVRRDPVTKEWTLEGGALVLADKGVCLIDEFDKMNDQDRTSIHEAMEQQSISISKAGIITSLQARCAVIAAANPIGGRYDPTMTFSQNVELSEPILSRFDCLCVVRDVVDPLQDERLARFVAGSHCNAHPENDVLSIEERRELAEKNHPVPKDILPQELFRKYLMYARSRVFPKLSQVDDEKIASLYAELRRESHKAGGVSITVRHVESIIRLTEAAAKMHLREYIVPDDLDLAIRVVLEGFISAQKFQQMNTLRKVFRKYLVYKKDVNELLLFALKDLLAEQLKYFQFKHPGEEPEVISIDIHDLEARARELEIHDLSHFYESQTFSSAGFRVDPQAKTIIKQF